MQPAHGGRITLRRARAEASAQWYEAEISTPDTSWQLELRVALDDGKIGGLEQAPDLPEWLAKLAQASLRGAFRVHQREGWPRRITRWRPDPDAAAEPNAEGDGGDAP